MDMIHTVSIRFDRDESKDIIIFDHPLTSIERAYCYASGYNDITLENCVAMVPIKYTGDHTNSFYFHVLPHYIALYAWEFGRSYYTIQRTLKDNTVITLALYSDINWAKWSRDFVNQLTTTLNHNQSEDKNGTQSTNQPRTQNHCVP